MKKTALTIGLFSLVMVATSFAAPQTLTATNISVTADTDGSGAVGGPQKKKDAAELKLDTDTQSSLGRINQSLGGNKKLD